MTLNVGTSCEPNGLQIPPKGCDRASLLTQMAVRRRFAALNGDINPIYLHSFLAIQFGLRSNVAHGMFLLARCISAVQAAGVQLCSFHTHMF